MRQAEWTVESAFGANPTSIATAREFVREALQRHGLRHLVDDVRLVVSELSTNAMLHARTPFTVTLTGTREGAVLLTVRDGAPHGPARTSAQVLDTSGRGLSIVDLVSSDWGVSPAVDATHAKSVWASFQAPAEWVPASPEQ